MRCEKILSLYVFFLFNDTATTEIYTLSLHDALPIFAQHVDRHRDDLRDVDDEQPPEVAAQPDPREEHEKRHREQDARSEEHTSELQSRQYLVCRLLLEKKKKIKLHSSDFSISESYVF